MHVDVNDSYTYETRRRNSTLQNKTDSRNSEIEVDCDVEIQNWPYPVQVETIHEGEGNEETSIQVYTDGSKQEQEVGFGAVILKGREMIANYNINLITDALNIRQNNLPYSKY